MLTCLGSDVTEIDSVPQVDKLVRSSRAIYQRCGRLCDVVTADMERFEAGPFTERVLDSVRVLRREIMPVFSRRVSDMIRVRRGGGWGYCCCNLTLSKV